MADPPPPSPAPLARTSRRGSWARAFDRVRAAMKRRSSSNRMLPTVEQHDRPSQEPAATAPEPINTISQTPAVEDETANAEPEPTMAPVLPTNEAPIIDVDADIDVDDDPAEDEEDTPIPTFSSRTAMADEKARDLFAKYNMRYDPRGKQRQQEPPNKIRRVEKPVRLRVHWTCHECRLQFGLEKVCASCGHRRCRECIRHPPKRAREPLQFNEAPVHDEALVHEAVEEPAMGGEEQATTDPDLLSYREEPAAPPRSNENASPNGTPRTSAPVATAGEPLSSPQLEIDDDAEIDYANLRSTQYTIYTRPRAAIHSVLHPPTKTTRRTCHECTATLRRNGNGSQDCPNCGHVKCDLCTPATESQLQEPGPSNQQPEEEVPMYRAVKRVYRKTRQRVRYRCENCNTHFVDSDRCTECGHERCQACHREP
ncbi:hypothetical protein PRZ48_014094 [Zasmidium cellare]|uniref:Uncharacterized protein n=1 Tax=Zasmidium cellare TaxID=395010 RepID=A0ABR0E0I6_ZASCE|nr:hypothetical protein PRZ48_014094 [Zasmidium cellare]